MFLFKKISVGMTLAKVKEQDGIMLAKVKVQVSQCSRQQELE